MGCASSKELDSRPVIKSSSKNHGSHLSESQIVSRIRTVESTRSVTLGSCKARYAYMTQRGYYPDDLNKANQDALSVNHKFANTKQDAWLSVYDGHGKYGDRCAQFVAKKLPEMTSKLIQLEKVRAWRKLKEEKQTEKKDGDSSPDPGDIANITLSKDTIHKACVKSHTHCNEQLHKTNAIDDSLSGTTSISAYFHGPRSRITVCNVGDSRAILGQANTPVMASNRSITTESSRASATSRAHNNLKAYPLSRDQTPYRKDERIRVKKCGARILSLDQLEGYEPIPAGFDENGESESNDLELDLDLGEEIDEYGDPPRVWSKDGSYPGTAFTRSIGDAIAEDLGVFAEPEIITREITSQDKIIVLASDGVFEFLTNQSVIDICAKFEDPLEACRAVVAEAYELWLQYEERTDDITILCIFLDELLPSTDPILEDVSTTIKTNEKRKSMMLKQHAVNRPLRQLTRKNILKDMIDKKKMLTSMQSDDLEIDFSPFYSNKKESDKEHIANAIHSAKYFRNITDSQREEIIKILISKHVNPGDVVIEEGDSDPQYTYIIDYGNFDVFKRESSTEEEGTSESVGQEYTLVHSYYGSRETKAHPTFGELALIHMEPRDATVRASSKGHLWLLPKVVFQKIVMTQNEKRIFSWILFEALKNQGWLIDNGLFDASFEEIEEVVMSKVEEDTFNEGSTICSRGQTGTYIYFIVFGLCESDKSSENQEYKENMLIGDEILNSTNEEKYSHTITVSKTTKCLKISLETIREGLFSE